MARNTIIASNGAELDINSMAHTYTYSSGLLATDTVKYTDNIGVVDSWVQTYTWTDGSITSPQKQRAQALLQGR